MSLLFFWVVSLKLSMTSAVGLPGCLSDGLPVLLKLIWVDGAIGAVWCEHCSSELFVNSDDVSFIVEHPNVCVTSSHGLQ